MAEQRLIDANALLEEIEDWHDGLGGTMNPADWGIQNVLQSVMDYIIEAEDIDAIPVVRCKDCKNRGTPYNCPMRKLVMPWQGAGSYEDCTEDDGYCHMGVKKDGGAEV